MSFILLFKTIFYSYIGIHVIFSSSQIGRFGISQREIGVSDREILRGKNISCIRKKLALLTLLKINFFIVWGAIILLYNCSVEPPLYQRE